MNITAKTLSDFRQTINELEGVDSLAALSTELNGSVASDARLYALMRCLIVLRELVGEEGPLTDGLDVAERLTDDFTFQEVSKIIMFLKMSEFLEVMAGRHDANAVQQCREILKDLPQIKTALADLADTFAYKEA